MNEIFQAIRNYRWLEIIKSLPFQGGASSTRWVYLATCAVICGGWSAIVLAFIVLLFLQKLGEAEIATIAGLIVSLGGLVVGFSARSQNLKHTLQAQSQTGLPTQVEETLLSTKTEVHPHG